MQKAEPPRKKISLSFLFLSPFNSEEIGGSSTEASTDGDFFPPPPPPVFSVIGGRGGGGGLSQVAPKLSWHTWANDLNWSNAKLPANSVLSFKLLKKYLCERWGLLPMYAQSLLLTCRVPGMHQQQKRGKETPQPNSRKPKRRRKSKAWFLPPPALHPPTSFWAESVS